MRFVVALLSNSVVNQTGILYCTLFANEFIIMGKGKKVGFSVSNMLKLNFLRMNMGGCVHDRKKICEKVILKGNDNNLRTKLNLHKTYTL